MIAAFKMIDPRSPQWPLNRSQDQLVRGRYSKNIPAFQKWLKEECIEKRSPKELPTALLSLCLRTFEHNPPRRIDASHLVCETKEIDSVDPHCAEESLHCEKCHTTSSSQFETRTRWYCTGCNGGPFFSPQTKHCPGCGRTSERQEFKSDVPMRTDSEVAMKFAATT